MNYTQLMITLFDSAAPPEESLDEASDAPRLLLHPVLQGGVLHVVQGKVKEQGLVGDGLVIGGQGGQEGLHTRWGQHKLVKPVRQGLKKGKKSSKVI